MSTLTVTAAEARSNFSQIANAVNETGEKITVFKNSKPWVVISPVEKGEEGYVELIRSGILEGREQIAAGQGIEGIDELREAVSSIKAEND